MKFIDTVKLKMRAGNGGKGLSSFNIKVPNGGDGGAGGDIVIKGSEKMYDLAKYTEETHIYGNDGQGGKKNNLEGRRAKNLELTVPLTTLIYDKRRELVARIFKDKQTFTILRGGEGGKGNYYFGVLQHDSPNKYTHGQKGEAGDFTFELNLSADVVFIGVPNAGKSSLLNELTNSKAKVANYAFTTLSPQLGRLGDITLMDLPGLIEGTYIGKGPGKGFLKHTKSSTLVLHCVSMEDPNYMENYKLIRGEIKKLNETLFNKNELIVLTKTDSISKEKLVEVKSEFKKVSKNVVTCSIIDEEAIADLKKKISSMVVKSSE